MSRRVQTITTAEGLTIRRLRSSKGAQLATYGQIAELIGAWGAARQVGWALRRLPLPSPIPWHRVVNARGCIAMSPGREGSDWIQAELLRAEGIPVDGAGRLPLARFRWRPEL